VPGNFVNLSFFQPLTLPEGLLDIPLKNKSFTQPNLKITMTHLQTSTSKKSFLVLMCFAKGSDDVKLIGT
jgi:hypothetical protein